MSKLYFSFLYQPKGFCDEPEEQDSLILEFYAKDLDQWNRVWSTSGEGLTGFKHQHLLIDNADYYKKAEELKAKQKLEHDKKIEA